MEKEERNFEFKTTYSVAIHWLNPSLILCNNIAEVDESVYENMRFDYYNEDLDEYVEIYQWYLTDLNESDIEWLEEHFDGLYFTYSDLLDCYVLCVTHLGYGWDYTPCYTDLENAACGEGGKFETTRKVVDDNMRQ